MRHLSAVVAVFIAALPFEAQATTYTNPTTGQQSPGEVCETLPGVPCGGGSPSAPSSIVIIPSGLAAAGIVPVASTTAESGHILKGSGGNLYSLTVTALTATSGFLMVFNAATIPADGAVTPIICVPIPANPGIVNVNYNPGPPGVFSTGISAAISSTGCSTKTAIATGAWFTGAVE